MVTTQKNLNNNNQLKIAFESLDSSVEYIDHLNGMIKKLLAHYHQNELDLLHNELLEIIDFMDLYIQLMTKVYSLLRTNFPELNFKTDSIVALEVQLLGIVKALLVAKEKNDLLMLCDLLEYELVDNLTQWKIKALPELKKLKSI